MTGAVRIYFAGKKIRYCYPANVGIGLIKLMRAHGSIPSVVGTEEGAMCVHYGPGDKR